MSTPFNPLVMQPFNKSYNIILYYSSGYLSEKYV